ncbi:MAG: hypothetical protein QMD14_04905 [Candidatus Aenigmarchaeota archaeon]|nr:hypothetical protein [Candidatus Aenigmarchaeota archaeon]
MGELVAFRSIVKKIPEKVAADEESISATVQQNGFDVVYVPHALVYNKAPEKISEFVKQKERIHFGHLWVNENLSSDPRNFRYGYLLGDFFRNLPGKDKQNRGNYKKD